MIAVDSLADGISSSPSNSKTQPGMQFPQISIRDMVNAEHKMLTDALHLTHVHAVLGFSMGGMQAFQWAVSYPDFMDKIVSIVGSPQLTSWDMLVWRTELLAVEADPEWQSGRYTTEPKLHLLDSVHALVLTTPEYVATNTPSKDFEKFFAEQAEDGSFDANDSVRQTQAILTQDIAAPFGESLERAAAAIHVPVLIVINRQDHLVNPMTRFSSRSCSKRNCWNSTVTAATGPIAANSQRSAKLLRIFCNSNNRGRLTVSFRALIVIERCALHHFRTDFLQAAGN